MNEPNSNYELIGHRGEQVLDTGLFDMWIKWFFGKREHNVKIRNATLKDFDNIYKIGNETKEFQVSSTEPFIDKDELEYVIQSPKSVILVAEENNKIVGFIYSNAKDIEKPLENTLTVIDIT